MAVNDNANGYRSSMPRPIPARPSTKPSIVNDGSAGNTTTTVQRGVIAAVSPDDLNPTMCSVLINNVEPPRAGFTLPSGSGPFYPAGTTSATLNGKTVPITGPYYNVNNLGGSIVEVNTVTMTARLLQGTSDATPSNAYNIVATHVHTGGNDINGNPLPNQIDTSQLKGNPDLDSAPSLIGTPNIVAYIGANGTITTGGSYDAEVTFQTTLDAPDWMTELRLYAVPNGSQTDPLTNPGNFANKGTIAPSVTGAYEVLFHGFVAGVPYDLYVAYVDLQGAVGYAKFLITTATMPLEVSAGAFASMGDPTLITPVVISHGTDEPVNGQPGATAFDYEVPVVVLDSNGLATTPWLAEVQIVVRNQEKTYQIQYSNSLAPQASNPYTFIYPQLPVGTNSDGTSINYDLGVRYVDYAGQFSNVLFFDSVSSSQLQVGAPSLQKIPYGTSFSVSGTTQVANINNGGGTFSSILQFSLSITSSVPYVQWLDKIQLMAKENPSGVSDGDENPSNYSKLGFIPGSSYTNPIETTFGPMGNNSTWQIAIALVDHSGDTTACLPIYMSGLQNALPSLTPGISNVNFISDSDMAFASGNGYGSVYWTYAGQDPTRFHLIHGDQGTNQLTVDAHGGSPVGPVCAYTDLVYVISGQQYTLTCYSNLQDTHSPTFEMGIVNVTDKTANNATPSSIYQSIALANTGGGNKITTSLTWTATITGNVCLAFWATGIYGSGNWEHPQFELGAVYSGYKSGTAITEAESTIAHAAQSVQVQSVINTAAEIDVSNPQSDSQLPLENSAPQINDVIQSSSADRGVLNVDPAGGVVGNLPFAAAPTTIQSVINSSGQTTTTDFNGLVENAPDSSYPGYFSMTTSTAWEKTGLHFNLANGPLIVELKGYVAGASPDELALYLCCDQNTVNLDSNNGWLIQWYGTTVSILSKTTSGFASVASFTAPSNIATAMDHDFKIVVSGAGPTTFQIFADSATPFTYVDPTGLHTNGYLGLRSTAGGTVLLRDIDFSQSTNDGCQIVGSALGFNISGNLLATDFPGQTIHQTQGTYAGWEKLLPQTLVGYGNLWVKDSRAYPIPAGQTLWMQWTAARSAGSTGNYGPVIFDSAGNCVACQVPQDVALVLNGGAFTAFGTEAITANGSSDFQSHTFTMGMQNTTGQPGFASSTWRMMLFIDGSKVFDSTVTNTFTDPWFPGFIGGTTIDGIFVRDYDVQLGSYVTDAQGSVANVTNPNLVLNSQFVAGAGGVASSYAWTLFGGAPTCSSAGAYTPPGGVAYPTNNFSGTGNSGAYQNITVKPNAVYSFACLFFVPTGLPAGAEYATINLYSGPNVTGSLITATPILNGDVGAFYKSTASRTTQTNTGNLSQWVLVSGTFTTPSTTTSMTFWFQGVWGGNTGHGNFFAYAPMLWEGNKWQDFVSAEIGNSGATPIPYPNTPIGVQMGVGSGGSTQNTVYTAAIGQAVTESAWTASSNSFSTTPFTLPAGGTWTLFVQGVAEFDGGTPTGYNFSVSTSGTGTGLQQVSQQTDSTDGNIMYFEECLLIVAGGRTVSAQFNATTHGSTSAYITITGSRTSDT